MSKVPESIFISYQILNLHCILFRETQAKILFKFKTFNIQLKNKVQLKKIFTLYLDLLAS